MALDSGALNTEWGRQLRNAALVLLLLVGPAAAEAPADKTPVENKISNFLLDNGMEVVVIPDRRAPIVTHMVWYRSAAPTNRPANPA
jgi:zinc protease